MAPWPEQGNELKSIDKVNEIRSSSFDENQHPFKTEHLEEKGKSGKLDEPQDPQVLGLDEGQLKALLDEAITYKNPKDREGKSELFKELLQEVEADETTDTSSSGSKNPIHSTASSVRFNRAHRRHQQGSGGRHISERNRSGGSLQNLVAAYANELEAASGCRGRRGAAGRNNLRGSNSNVSARQREGGSLPSNVNHVQGVSGPSSSLFDEYKRTRTVISSPEDKVSPESGLCTDYSSSTNTPARKTSSTWGDEEGIEMEEIRSGAGRTYTSRATLELCTGGTGTVPSGSDDNMTSGACTSTDVDQSILFPLKSKCSPTQDDSDYQSQHITLPHSPLQLSTSLNSMRCILNSTPTPNEPSSNSATNAKSESSTANMVSSLSVPLLVTKFQLLFCSR
uniref:Uncharacterized protein n=2 Tax=Cacopsylla melanoneura TaxID=428564 RepID=A0A8D8YNF9_9HEMI